MQDKNIAPEGAILIQPGYAVTPTENTVHNGKSYTIRTVYDFYGGKWEGFVSMKEIK